METGRLEAGGVRLSVRLRFCFSSVWLTEIKRNHGQLQGGLRADWLRLSAIQFVWAWLSSCKKVEVKVQTGFSDGRISGFISLGSEANVVSEVSTIAPLRKQA